MHVDIQELKTGDTRKLSELISVFALVFKTESKTADPAHLEKLLQQENFFAITASVENKIVGGLTGNILIQHYTAKPLAYIFDLAVLPHYQRKGIGRQLIEFTTEHFRQRGFEEIFVQADQPDVHAVNFYRSTMPTAEEAVIHFYYLL